MPLISRVSFFALALLSFVSGPVHAEGGVLVFGGTGRLGTEIVKALISAGEKDVSVFARPSSDRSELESLGVTFVSGDAMVEEDVRKALVDGQYRVVIDALARDGDVDPAFYETTMHHIATWAAKSDVEQVILHGSVGAGLSRAIYPASRWAAMEGTLMAKDAGERYLIESGAPYTIIRNLSLLPVEVKESGKAKMVTDQSQSGPVTRDGLARLTIECLDVPRCMNEIFHAFDEDVELPERYRRAIEE